MLASIVHTLYYVLLQENNWLFWVTESFSSALASDLGNYIYTNSSLFTGNSVNTLTASLDLLWCIMIEWQWTRGWWRMETESEREGLESWEGEILIWDTDLKLRREKRETSGESGSARQRKHEKVERDANKRPSCVCIQCVCVFWMLAELM